MPLRGVAWQLLRITSRKVGKTNSEKFGCAAINGQSSWQKGMGVRHPSSGQTVCPFELIETWRLGK